MVDCTTGALSAGKNSASLLLLIGRCALRCFYFVAFNLGFIVLFYEFYYI